MIALNHSMQGYASIILDRNPQLPADRLSVERW